MKKLIKTFKKDYTDKDHPYLKWSDNLCYASFIETLKVTECIDLDIKACCHHGFRTHYIHNRPFATAKSQIKTWKNKIILFHCLELI